MKIFRKTKTSVGDPKRTPQRDSGGQFDRGSHEMTLNRALSERKWAEELSPVSTEYHLTISVTNGSLTRRELSLLLDVLNYQAVHYGINLTMQLAIYELYFRILGMKTESSEVLDGYIRKTLLVSELILKALKDKEFSLDNDQFMLLSTEVRKILEIGLMSKRTYRSRYVHFRPERLLAVRIVPVDKRFLTRRQNSEPYSSYCKGYGESHPSTHKVKTRPTAELDGDTRTPTEIESRKTFIQCMDPMHSLSNCMIIKFENLELDEL